MIRKFCAAITLAATVVTGAAAQERVVNVYNWSDYIDPQVLDNFTKETGIKVVYDTYDNNEIVETKLLTGNSGYDIVVPTGPFLQRMSQANIFLRLDKTRLPNIKNEWPEIMQRIAAYDPGNEHAINYMWGTTGIGINVKKVRERLGPDQPLNTWELLMNPEISAKLKDCGIYVLDSAEDVFPGILNYVGAKPDSKAAEDLQKAGDALMKVRGNIRKFHSSEYINALANGDICMAVGYSGDILQAKKRADEAKNGVEVAYYIPKEGALMWFDNISVPIDAPHPQEALEFINYLLRPEVAAANSNFVSYASGNLAAKELVKPEIRNNPGIYPDDETFKRLFTATAFDQKSQRLLTRQWTRIKSGK
ncbi:polyamine ABC transporter substrate-binding protein [Microvirga sp. W0021]|uniref:Putrescine-binding periplasmic protein n=1 Tax=Hohaiivirga grylli TaxID=3133970 RepID=A0ABV0BJE6_9HYPH